jgi:pheromone shutdown-related protein TraB
MSEITLTEQSDTVTRLAFEEREIILLGTAHVSGESVTEVRRVITEEQPDHVCVEIDAGRYKAMTEGQDWSNMSIGKVLKQRRGFLLLANLALTSFQRKLGSDLGSKPGEEMRAAIDSARETGAEFSFCDREIQTTLRRAWSKSSLWNKNKMIASLLGSVFGSEKLEAEEIEKLKEKSALEEMMQELASYLPSVKEVLIDERDRYLATKIFQAKGKKIVAVIGAGHAGGIVKIITSLAALNNGNRTSQFDLSEIETVPPPSKFTKVLPWIIPAVVLAIIASGFIRSGFSQGIEMFGYWVAVNALLGGVGALVALAHPVTILVTMAAAPFTSLNPTIGVGIVSGIVEGAIRKPRVIDFEHLHDDILSVRGFFRNRFTHALVVFFLASVGSAVGTFVAFPFLLTLIR